MCKWVCTEYGKILRNVPLCTAMDYHSAFDDEINQFDAVADPGFSAWSKKQNAWKVRGLDQSNVFFHNYKKLADLPFLYCFMKSKINSAKSLPPMGTCNSRTVASVVFTASCLDNCANSPLLVKLRILM